MSVFILCFVTLLSFAVILLRYLLYFHLAIFVTVFINEQQSQTGLHCRRDSESYVGRCYTAAGSMGILVELLRLYFDICPLSTLSLHDGKYLGYLC